MVGFVSLILSMNEQVLLVLSSDEVKKNTHFLLFHSRLVVFVSLDLLVVFPKFSRFFLCAYTFFYFLQLFGFVLIYWFSFHHFWVFNLISNVIKRFFKSLVISFYHFPQFFCEIFYSFLNCVIKDVDSVKLFEDFRALKYTFFDYIRALKS